MSVAEFDAKIRPYLMHRVGDNRWEFRMLYAHIDRFYWLLKTDVRNAKFAKLEKLLDEDDELK